MTQPENHASDPLSTVSGHPNHVPSWHAVGLNGTHLFAVNAIDAAAAELAATDAFCTAPPDFRKKYGHVTWRVLPRVAFVKPYGEDWQDRLTDTYPEAAVVQLSPAIAIHPYPDG